MYATISNISDIVFFLYNGVIYSQKIPQQNINISICHIFFNCLCPIFKTILQYAQNVIPPIISLK